MTGRILDVDEAAYHADPCARPSLSSSTAKLVDRSPLHAWAAHPRLGGRPPKATASMDRGTLIHKLLLGGGPQLAIVEAKDWRTKAAKELREQARADGRLPVLVHKHRQAREAADVIAARLDAEGIVLSGESEVAIEWTEEATSGPVLCRARLDHVRLDIATIYDVKTAEDARTSASERAIENYGYHVQRAAYVRGASKVWPELAGRWRYELVFVEPSWPHAINYGPLDGVQCEDGERRWVDAVERWSFCLSKNYWPGYVDGEPTRFEAPPWKARRLMEE